MSIGFTTQRAYRAMTSWRISAAIVSFFALSFSTGSTFTVRPAMAQDLMLQSIEELMSIDITSASKKSEALSRTAAAVHVITEEDIRRSGAKSLLDVLRLAPGVHSAKISSVSPAVTIRGFNDRFNSILQVFIDGRSIYQNLSSSVDWAFYDIDLDEIKQIEVIR